MREQLAFKDPAIKDLASQLHESWRKKWSEKNPGVPRMKVNMDGSYLDINKPFDDLHYDWQRENLVASIAAKQACLMFPHDDDAASSFIHQEWMKRNPKTDTNANQHVPYDSLPASEKEKDKDQVSIMRKAMKSNPEGFRDDKPEIGPHKIRDLELITVRDLLQSIPDKSTTDAMFRSRVKEAEKYVNSPDPFENVRNDYDMMMLLLLLILT